MALFADQNKRKPLKIGMIAGEHSGDKLAADLICSLSKLTEVTFEGIPGPLMRQAGCTPIIPMENIVAAGLTEILSKLPHLWLERRKIIHYFLKNPPDIFIGVDAPEFNLSVELKLRKAGIKTVHTVSPSVWAWRPKRIYKIARAVDLMLTLFPFENGIYQKAGVSSCYVGHPLAQTLRPTTKYAARQKLGLPDDVDIITLMPGSRAFEIQNLTPAFLETALWCLERNPRMQFIVPMVTEQLKNQFEGHLNKVQKKLPILLVVGQSHDAISASDAVLLASGTATLECLLLERPMVVAYRLSRVTFALLKRWVKVPFCALPNLLADHLLVPEFIQDEVNARDMGSALLKYLAFPEATLNLLLEYQRIGKTLSTVDPDTAAREILAL